MFVKEVLLFLLLLLSNGTSFAFQNEILNLEKQKNIVADFEIEEDSVDLFQGTISDFRINNFQADLFTGSKSYFLQSSFESRIQKEYLKVSKRIEPGLDIPSIIFPFHVFF